MNYITVRGKKIPAYICRQCGGRDTDEARLGRHELRHDKIMDALKASIQGSIGKKIPGRKRSRWDKSGLTSI